MNKDLFAAINIIKHGGVIAFPTETVYGLGGDATNDKACEKIFLFKNRPSINPLIIHVSDLTHAKMIGEFNEDANKLSKLWPGPLTLIMNLKENTNICNKARANLNSVGIRIPSHPVARELIREVGVPIAAPSANISGYVSSTKADHVKKDFKDQLFILPDTSSNTTKYGLESTIIDVTSDQPILLRYGFISPQVIEEILGKQLQLVNVNHKIKAPGMLDKHYSPNAKIRLNVDMVYDNEIALNFYNSNLGGDFNLSIVGDLSEAAANLYELLRKLDEIATSKAATIAVAPIPNTGIGLAINDRLTRAAK